MIRDLLREANRKGVPSESFGSWVHRKYGDLTIYRKRRDGLTGCSLPCVLCKREMDKWRLQWKAYDGTQWVHSLQSDNIPPSRPTSKQKRLIFS